MNRKLLLLAAAAAVTTASMAQLPSGGAVVNGNVNVGSSPALQGATQGGVTLGTDASIGASGGTNAQREADRRNRETAQGRTRTDASVRTENEAKGSASGLFTEGALSGRVGGSTSGTVTK